MYGDGMVAPASPAPVVLPRGSCTVWSSTATSSADAIIPSAALSCCTDAGATVACAQETHGRRTRVSALSKTRRRDETPNLRSYRRRRQRKTKKHQTGWVAVRTSDIAGRESAKPPMQNETRSVLVVHGGVTRRTHQEGPCPLVVVVGGGGGFIPISTPASYFASLSFSQLAAPSHVHRHGVSQLHPEVSHRRGSQRDASISRGGRARRGEAHLGHQNLRTHSCVVALCAWKSVVRAENLMDEQEK